MITSNFFKQNRPSFAKKGQCKKSLSLSRKMEQREEIDHFK